MSWLLVTHNSVFNLGTAAIPNIFHDLAHAENRPSLLIVLFAKRYLDFLGSCKLAARGVVGEHGDALDASDNTFGRLNCLMRPSY